MTSSYHTLPPVVIDLWRSRHQYCHDTPPPFTDIREADFVSTEHSGHGDGCQQLLAARQALA